MERSSVEGFEDVLRAFEPFGMRWKTEIVLLALFQYCQRVAFGEMWSDREEEGEESLGRSGEFGRTPSLENELEKGRECRENGRTTGECRSDAFRSWRIYRGSSALLVAQVDDV